MSDVLCSVSRLHEQLLEVYDPDAFRVRGEAEVQDESKY
jgi:hypothetical protein